MTAANDIEPTDFEPGEPSAEDRRLHSRVRFPKVRVQAPGPEGWQDEFLQDLSVGGVFLVTPRTLPVGGSVSLRLLVPDTETPMETQALVTRIEQGSRDADSGIALAFDQLRDDQRDQLASLVERFGHEPTVQVFDDETGEPAPDPMSELLADVDEIGRRWLETKEEVTAVRAAVAEHEQSLRRNQESLEELLRRLQRSLRHMPRGSLPGAVDEDFGRAPQPEEVLARATEEEERLQGLLESVREDLAGERQKNRELSREVDDLKESLQSLESPEADRDRRIQMLTAELLQAKEQAHRHEAEAAEARLALAELRSQADLTSGEHLPPPSPAAIREEAQDDEFEVDFAIESNDADEASAGPDELEPMDELPPEAPVSAQDLPTLHAIPVPEEASFADVAAEMAGDVDEEPAEEAELPATTVEVEIPVVESEGPARLVSVDEETLGPEVLDAMESFQAQLSSGSRIRLTERFGRLEPVSRGDIQVSDWLRERDRLSAEPPSSPDMSEEQLVRVLHVFFQRELIRLTP
ncbi:MAG: PilZ domain-containing protein [Acidobacteriota bacterium]